MHFFPTVLTARTLNILNKIKKDKCLNDDSNMNTSWY